MAKEQLEILTPQEIADKLHVHINTVYNYITNGKLEAVKRGGKYYITDKAFYRFLEYTPEEEEVQEEKKPDRSNIFKYK